MVEAATILFIVIGIVGGFIYVTLISPWLGERGAVRHNSFIRYGSVITDPDYGLVGEIKSMEDIGQGKVRIRTDYGEATTVYEDEIHDLDRKHNICGRGRPHYIIRRRRPNNSGQLATEGSETLAREGELERLKDAQAEQLHVELYRAKDLAEIARPTKTSTRSEGRE